MKIVVGGGSGYVGRALVRSFSADGHEVVVLSRRAGSGRAAWADAPAVVDGADAILNVAGASIGGRRWTSGRKETIRSSRLETTNALVAAIASAERKPAVFVSASGIDYYGDSGDVEVDESAPAGKTFLARVVADWEAALAAAPVRTVALRQGLVIGAGALAVRLMALPYRLFVGGRVGSGRQWFPWIHLDDLVRLYRRAVDDASLAGPVNAVAPQQLRQEQAARELAAVLNRPAVLPTPAFVLRVVLGEQADLLLHGQRAVSRTLAGFDFRFEDLRAALADALGKPEPRDE